MGLYWWEVIKEAFWESAEAVGYSWQVLIYLSVVLVLTAVLVWRPQGWNAMRANLVKTIVEVVGIGIIAWLPFLLIHIARASYVRWKNTDEQRQVALKQASDLQLKIDTEKPELTFRFNQIATNVWPEHSMNSNGKFSSMIIAIGDLSNIGRMRSVARNWSMKVTLLDGSTKDARVIGTNIKVIYLHKDENDRNPEALSMTAYLPEITANRPLEYGDRRPGWILFGLPDVPFDQLKNKGVSFTLGFEDVLAKSYTANFVNQGIHDSSVYFPGIGQTVRK